MVKSKITSKIIQNIAILFILGQILAQAEEYISPALEWPPEEKFSKFIEEVIRERIPPIKKLLNYSGVVSTVAIPLATSPVDSIKELEAGKKIGALYLSTGSLRLKLPPGAYQVAVNKINNEWRAYFLDGNNKAMIDVPAEVKEASKVDKPFAYVDRSVCYRFDKILVCI